MQRSEAEHTEAEKQCACTGLERNRRIDRAAASTHCVRPVPSLVTYFVNQTLLLPVKRRLERLHAGR